MLTARPVEAGPEPLADYRPSGARLSWPGCPPAQKSQPQPPGALNPTYDFKHVPHLPQFSATPVPTALPLPSRSSLSAVPGAAPDLGQWSRVVPEQWLLFLPVHSHVSV